ncbi:hypothetical protein [Paraliobacillus ryukyuensis]|uniref:hypothetical protein n=1 Tax=Paraliobacillus ryukyuensis TaxID=200904 RepID=UPI0009A64613|nr:hypothetical protein [Paraliobacillus ryukyuensis]
MNLKKTVWSIEELNAYRTAYGNPFLKKEIFTALIKPFLVCFFAVFILTYYWWLALIGGGLGALYGYIVLMKFNVQRLYQQEAMIQRNRFINNMTQLLINPSVTVFDALKWCTRDDVAKGEFKDDVKNLISNIMDANNEEIQSAYDQLKEKYRTDFVFGIFLDSLITMMLEGREEIDKIKDIKTWHNDVLKQRNLYIRNKEQYVSQFKMTSLYTVAVVFVLTFAAGFDGYIKYFAHNVAGWISSAIVLAAMAFYFHTFQQRLVDDEIMEVKLWKRI